MLPLQTTMNPLIGGPYGSERTSICVKGPHRSEGGHGGEGDHGEEGAHKGKAQVYLLAMSVT